MVKLKISRRRKSQLVVSRQVVINQSCSLAVIFCSFISYLIGRETINNPHIFSGVHRFAGKTAIGKRVFSKFNPLMPNSDLQILLCLTPDDFTLQGDPLGNKRLRCVCCPKVEISAEMFRAKLQTPGQYGAAMLMDLLSPPIQWQENSINIYFGYLAD